MTNNSITDDLISLFILEELFRCYLLAWHHLVSKRTWKEMKLEFSVLYIGNSSEKKKKKRTYVLVILSLSHKVGMPHSPTALGSHL